MNGPDPFKRWAQDDEGRSTLVGLTYVETREYFALEKRDWADRASEGPGGALDVMNKRRKRFLMLYDRHETARARRMARPQAAV